jgi:hypothetical protein
MGHALIACPTRRPWTLLVTQWLQTTNFKGEGISDDDRATQVEPPSAPMKAARGYIYPEWELAARTDTDFADAYNRIYKQAVGEGRHVSAKVRQFEAVAACRVHQS